MFGVCNLLRAFLFGPFCLRPSSIIQYSVGTSICASICIMYIYECILLSTFLPFPLRATRAHNVADFFQSGQEWFGCNTVDKWNIAAGEGYPKFHPQVLNRFDLPLLWLIGWAGEGVSCFKRRVFCLSGKSSHSYKSALLPKFLILLRSSCHLSVLAMCPFSLSLRDICSSLWHAL